MNAATMVNSGLEFLVAYHNHQRALKFDVSANLSTLRNEVTKLGVSNEPRTDGYCRTEVGREVGSFYGYVYQGIFQSQTEIDNRVNSEGNTSIRAVRNRVTAYTQTLILTVKLRTRTKNTWAAGFQRFITD
jgi:hypothetical protein